MSELIGPFIAMFFCLLAGGGIAYLIGKVDGW
jgi:hypothetical protein